MLFNSIAYFIFLPVVVAGYLLLPGRWARAWLLAGSLFFYAYWNPINLPLLIGIIILNHFGAVYVATAPDRARAKAGLILVALVNLGVLAFFKYLEFGLTILADLVGLAPPGWIVTLRESVSGQLGLPLGISFFTFQALAYSIDCYRGHLQPSRNLARTGLFISYFPQLIAGPIVRGAQLLPQLREKLPFSGANLRAAAVLISLGLFKKVVVADNLALLADPYFGSPSVGMGDAWVGILAFTFQIYADFSGYVDVALGSALLIGIKLPANFNQPYLKTNITEFWRAWHMTLSSWFRDYLYIPLGGSRRGTPVFYRNLLITMLVVGLWHGAAYTFILWGGYHGLLLVLHKMMRNRFKQGTPLPKPIKGLLVFILVALGWVFFRAQDLETAWFVLGQALGGPLQVDPATNFGILVVIPLVLIFEWLLSERPQPPAWYPTGRLVISGFLLVLAFLFNTGQSNQFIYFVF